MSARVPLSVATGTARRCRPRRRPSGDSLLMLPILTPDQSAAWDRKAAAAGIELATLMECAGRAVLAVMAPRYARRDAGWRAGRGRARGTTAATGGCWLARSTRSTCRSGSPRPRARERRSASGWPGSPGREGVREVAPDGPWPSVGLVVDALLGTGASGAPRGRRSRRSSTGCSISRLPLVAVDGPTGLDLATGIVHGAPRADLTVTFGGFRRGHLLARDEVGDHVVADIGHPPPDPLAGAGHRSGGRGLAAPTRARERTRGAGARRRRWRRRGHDRRRAHGGARRFRGWRRTGPRRRARGDRRRHWSGRARSADPLAVLRCGAVRGADGPRRARGRRRHRPGARPGAGSARAGAGAGTRQPSVVLDADALVAFQGAVEELAALADDRDWCSRRIRANSAPSFPTLASQRERGSVGRRGGGGRAERRRRAAEGRTDRRRREGPRQLHRRLGQPRSRHRRQRRRAERHHRRRRWPRTSIRRSPRRWAPRRWAAAPISPRGESRLGVSGPWMSSPRCPTSGESGSCCGARHRRPHPPILLELPRPQSRERRAPPGPRGVHSASCTLSSAPHAPPRSPARPRPSHPVATGGRKTGPSSATSAGSPPIASSIERVFVVSPSSRRDLAAAVPDLEGPSSRPTATLLARVFAALIDPLDQSLWLARNAGWVHYQPELQIWDQGTVPDARRHHRVRRGRPVQRALTSAPGAAGSTLPRGGLVPMPGRAPARPIRPTTVDEVVAADPIAADQRRAVPPRLPDASGAAHRRRSRASTTRAGIIGTSGLGLFYPPGRGRDSRAGAVRPAVAVRRGRDELARRRVDGHQPHPRRRTPRSPSWRASSASSAGARPPGHRHAVQPGARARGTGHRSLWAATDFGLARMDPDEQRIELFDESRGLPDSRVYRRGRAAGSHRRRHRAGTRTDGRLAPGDPRGAALRRGGLRRASRRAIRSGSARRGECSSPCRDRRTWSGRAGLSSASLQAPVFGFGDAGRHAGRADPRPS